MTRPRTLQEIGDHLKLTRERIRQIEKKAMTQAQPVAHAPAAEGIPELNDNGGLRQMPKGHGWVLEDAGGSQVAKRCACFGSAQSEAAVLDRAHIPARYRDCTLANFAPKTIRSRDALKISRKFIANYPGPGHRARSSSAPAAWGKPTWRWRSCRSSSGPRTPSGLFYDFRDLIRDIQNTFSPESDLSESDILTPVFCATSWSWTSSGPSVPRPGSRRPSSTSSTAATTTRS